MSAARRREKQFCDSTENFIFKAKRLHISSEAE